ALLLLRSLILLMAASATAAAQDLGTMNPKPLPPLEHPDDPKTPAKELFGRKTEPVPMAARSIGYYTHGCLVGDKALPRGGPMLTGHWSHQVGLDADIWLTPMPDRELTRQEREEMSATNIVTDDWMDVRPEIWSEKYVALYKIAAQSPEVERVLANPAIKKALCRDVKGDRSWLHKIRPVLGHNYHFHVRITCPADSADCKAQTPPPDDEGC